MKYAIALTLALSACSASDIASTGAGLACGVATAATGGIAGLACIPVAYGAGAAFAPDITTIYVDSPEGMMAFVMP